MATPTTDPGSVASLSRHSFAVDGSTHAQDKNAARTIAFAVGALVGPVVLGVGLGALLRSWRAGLIAGGASALAFGLVRWQFQRWFTDEPAYTVERSIGELEIRQYAPRLEAHTRMVTDDFDDARERGFRRLASYIFGGNTDARLLAMTVPVTIVPRSGSHTVAFVMPAGELHSQLPHPDDPLIELVDVPARRVAVLRYHGGYRAETVERHAAELRELVAAAGLTTRGEPMFAGFDPPSTLPFLRRTEIWIELA